MPAAKELFDAGDLRGAIEELTREVKAKPTDVSRRTFLFELLSFAGEYERAEKQLDVIGAQSATAEIGVQVYRNNIKAERARRRLFSDGLRPHFLTDPPAYVRLYLDAINLIRGGQFAEARELLDRADEERPAFNGKFNGESFSNFRDADELVGPVLELIVQDNYTWLPFEQIQKIEVRPPAQLRDLIWIMARIESESITGEAFIPVLYSGSSEHADDRVKLGRMTDWRQLSDDLATAAGLRLLMVDGEDRALLDARTIEIGIRD